MRDMRGKAALVTGASRGIGVHIARALLAEGVRVGLVARDASALERVATELAAKSGGRAATLPCDLSDRRSLEGLVARATEQLGGVDILVNNAAIDRAISYWEESTAQIEAMIALDLTVPMLLARACLGPMLARGSGHIVNISSLAGKSASAYAVSYSAAKGGLISFSHSLRAEVRAAGVSVSVVCPGFVSDEGMFANHQTAADVEAPAAAGTSTPAQVATAVIRAIRQDRAEILVNPGPMRLAAAFNQLAPDAVAWMQKRLGVPELFRKVAAAERVALLTARADDAKGTD